MTSTKRSSHVSSSEVFDDPPITLDYEMQEISNGATIPIVLTQHQPTVSWPTEPGSVYTLIMYDYDAPNPPYLHWLISDIQRGSGQTRFPYQPPNPPNNENHTYTVEVFRQLRPWMSRISGQRSGFPLDEVIRRQGLQSIGSTSFHTGHQVFDGYLMSESFSPEAGLVFDGRRFPEEYNDFDPYFGHPEDFYEFE